MVIAVIVFYIEPNKWPAPPVNLFAQLVQRCSGITEVKGSNPAHAWIISGFLCNDLLYNSFFIPQF